MMFHAFVLIVLLFVVAVCSAEGYTVVPGKWVRTSGPNLNVYHVTDVLGMAPSSHVTWTFKPVTQEAPNIQLNDNLLRHDHVFPHSCFEVDRDHQPLPEPARSRFGGFERNKQFIFPVGSGTIRGNAITIRMGRVPNTTVPLLIAPDSPMLIRCGPIMQPPPEVKRQPVDASLFENGAVPEGWTPYVYDDVIPSSSFLVFEIGASAPVAMLTNDTLSSLAASRAKHNRNLHGGFDATEETIRRDGLAFRVSIGYDAWKGYDDSDAVRARIKQFIAASVWCEPLPCHRPLRNKTHAFMSIEEWKAAQVNTNLSFSLQEPLHFDDPSVTVKTDRDRILRAEDITLTPTEALIRISGDDLYERGFDLLPAATPMQDHIKRDGKPVKHAETLHYFRFLLPRGITTRYSSLSDDAKKVSPGMTYTMQAYPHWPPQLRLSEYNATREVFGIAVHAVRLTENCVAGRNSTGSCDSRIVVNVMFCRPRQYIIPYRQSDQFYAENFFVAANRAPAYGALAASKAEDAGCTTPSDSCAGRQRPTTLVELKQCRRAAFGWPSIAQTFIDPSQVIDPSRNEGVILERRVQPNFDVDEPEALLVAAHYSMFITFQPPQAASDHPVELHLVPSPGDVYLVIRQQPIDAASVKLDVEASWRGEVLHNHHSSAVDPSVVLLALVREGLGYGAGTNDVGRLPACLDAAVDSASVTASNEPTCGGTAGVSGQVTLRTTKEGSTLRECIASSRPSGGVLAWGFHEGTVLSSTAAWTVSGLPLRIAVSNDLFTLPREATSDTTHDEL